jgi:hypothetical protein
MAVVQIDESELLSQRAVVETVNRMLADKGASKLLLQARKMAEPNAVIPEIDAAAPLESELAAFRKELADERAARAAEKQAQDEQRAIATFTNKWNEQKSALRRDGWRDDGIAEIEKHAQNHGIADLEIAAAHYEKLHPPAEVAQPSGTGGWNFFDGPTEDDKFVDLMIASRGDDDGALNREIGAAIKDFRNQSGGPSNRRF